MSSISSIGEQDIRGQLPPRFRVTAGLLLRIAVSAGLLAAAFWLTSDKLDWSQLARLDLPTIAVSAALSLAIVWLLAWRWLKVTRLVIPETTALPRFGTFAAQTWLGLAANQVLPSIVAGDALRIGLLARQNLPLGSATGSVLLDRVFGLVGLAVLTVASAFLLAPDFAIPSLAVAAIVLGGTALLAVLWRLFGSRFRAILPLHHVTPATGAALVAMAMAAHLANIAVFLVVAHALGADLPLLPTIAVMCAVLLVGVLPISVAGWGVRELALVQALGHLGVAPDTIILASVTYGLVLFMMQAPGFLLLARRDRP